MSDQGGAPPGKSWFRRAPGPTLESWRLAKGLGRVENSAEVEERGEKRGGPKVETGDGREGGGKGRGVFPGAGTRAPLGAAGPQSDSADGRN